MPDQAPELYQLIGAALRDVAQARVMSDLFSRQISFIYEGDGVLRHFPVPRVDIEEAELTLHFAIKEVALDPERHSSRNAAIGSLFDQYSVQIVRETMHLLRKHVHEVAAVPTTDEPTRTAIAGFEKRFLSDESRELLSSRLLQYFNESQRTIIRGNGTLDVEEVTKAIDKFATEDILGQPDAKTLRGKIPDIFDQKKDEARNKYIGYIQELAAEIEKLRDKYPDYKIVIDPSPSASAVPGAPISSIKIKSIVRNYKWSKVDVDDVDLRNIRTLTPE